LRKAILKPEYYDGSFINDNIMKAADENYTRPDVSQFTKKKAATLEDFFA
jgi:cytochrome c-type biogenesis protein CcmE